MLKVLIAWLLATIVALVVVPEVSGIDPCEGVYTGDAYRASEAVLLSEGYSQEEATVALLSCSYERVRPGQDPNRTLPANSSREETDIDEILNLPDISHYRNGN